MIWAPSTLLLDDDVAQVERLEYWISFVVRMDRAVSQAEVEFLLVPHHHRARAEVSPAGWKRASDIAVSPGNARRTASRYWKGLAS